MAEGTRRYRKAGCSGCCMVWPVLCLALFICSVWRGACHSVTSFAPSSWSALLLFYSLSCALGTGMHRNHIVWQVLEHCYLKGIIFQVRTLSMGKWNDLLRDSKPRWAFQCLGPLCQTLLSLSHSFEESVARQTGPILFLKINNTIMKYLKQWKVIHRFMGNKTEAF